MDFRRNLWTAYLSDVVIVNSRPITTSGAALNLGDAVREQVGRITREHLRYRMERDVRSTAFLDAYRIGAMDSLTNDTEGVSPG